jgi:hypothetical protein
MAAVSREIGSAAKGPAYQFDFTSIYGLKAAA